jgi:hypothetical protein
VYNTLNVVAGGLIESIGGAKGLGGSKTGTGVAGADGVAGTAGQIFKFNVASGVITIS